MPELFYLAPTMAFRSGVSLGGQGGFRHESNGRPGAGSRSLNTIYVQPVASVDLGSYRLSLGPRLWLYAGRLSDNPDIKRYRGNTGLFAEIGEGDGLRITTNRSEEHTSELQSLMRISYAVFCLKKNNYTKQNSISIIYSLY